MKKLEKGIFITIEGADGAGKSTVSRFVKEYLEKKGLLFIITREPGGTPIGENIREILLDNNNAEMSPKTEALLYAASRAQHVDEKIKPFLDKGFIVVSDRFILSSLSYQGYGRGLGIPEIKVINDFAIQALGNHTNNVLLLNIDKDIATSRVSKRDHIDRLENAGDSFHKKTHEGFQAILGDFENGKLAIEDMENMFSKKQNYNVNIINSSQPKKDMLADVEIALDNILKDVL